MTIGLKPLAEPAPHVLAFRRPAAYPPSTTAAEPAATRSVAHVLVIDNDAKMRGLLALLLEASGYSVATAGNATDALRLVGSGNPDAIVTDVQMPGVSGGDLCRRLRARRETAYIPIVVFSANWEDGMSPELGNLHGFDVVDKIDGGEAVVRILDRRLLGRTIRVTPTTGASRVGVVSPRSLSV